MTTVLDLVKPNILYSKLVNSRTNILCKYTPFSEILPNDPRHSNQSVTDIVWIDSRKEFLVMTYGPYQFSSKDGYNWSRIIRKSGGYSEANTGFNQGCYSPERDTHVGWSYNGDSFYVADKLISGYEWGAYNYPRSNGQEVIWVKELDLFISSGDYLTGYSRDGKNWSFKEKANNKVKGKIVWSPELKFARQGFGANNAITYNGVDWHQAPVSKPLKFDYSYYRIIWRSDLGEFYMFGGTRHLAISKNGFDWEERIIDERVWSVIWIPQFGVIFTMCDEESDTPFKVKYHGSSFSRDGRSFKYHEIQCTHNNAWAYSPHLHTLVGGYVGLNTFSLD